MVSFEYGRVRSSTTAKREFDDNFLVIMHLGVAKLGLLQLAKREVVSRQ